MCTEHPPSISHFNPLPPHGGRQERIGSEWILRHFNPLPPHGGRLTSPSINIPESESFQSTPSTRRETSVEYTEQYEGIYFNPLPPHGGRLSLRTRLYKLPYFNPLPPHGGRPPSFCFPGQFTGFQSTPSTRRETWAGVTEDDFNDISIHSLHTEGDLLRYVHGGCAISISIHSLHTEGDEDGAKHCTNCGISIHSLHTEGDFSMSKRKSILFISIHSLHTEGDVFHCLMKLIFSISIHSLHTEGDRSRTLFSATRIYFNPLPPHGGRPQNCTGKRFSFRLSLYNPAKKDAKDYILHPKK